LNATIKVIYAFFFGCSAATVAFFVANEVLNLPGGPDSGPAIGIVCLMIGLAAAISTFAHFPMLQPLIGLETDLTSTAGGRLFAVASIVFAAAFPFATWDDTDAFNSLVFTPLVAVCIVGVLRWVVRGRPRRA
jgi:hypothetical protein